MSIQDFKKEVESVLLIRKWSPSTAQLLEILQKTQEAGNRLTKRELAKIVSEVVGSYETYPFAFEGADNSDLITLLMMATKTDDK